MNIMRLTVRSKKHPNSKTMRNIAYICLKKRMGTKKKKDKEITDVLDYEVVKKVALINQLTDAERFCLDAFLIGKMKESAKVVLAYKLSRPRESKGTDQAIYIQSRRWFATEKVQAYIEERKKEFIRMEDVDRLKGEIVSSGNYIRTKENVIEELNVIASKTTDNKMKAEILMKIADIEGMKKEMTKEEDDKITYFLPVKCSVCELYRRAKMAVSEAE